MKRGLCYIKCRLKPNWFLVPKTSMVSFWRAIFWINIGDGMSVTPWIQYLIMIRGPFLSRWEQHHFIPWTSFKFYYPNNYLLKCCSCICPFSHFWWLIYITWEGHHLMMSLWIIWEVLQDPLPACIFFSFWQKFVFLVA